MMGLRTKYQTWKKKDGDDYQKLSKNFTQGENRLFDLGTGYLFSNQQYNEQYLIFTLKKIDLEYGSVQVAPEDGKTESVFVDSLIKSAREHMPGFPSDGVDERYFTKKGWILIYQSLNDAIIKKAAKYIQEEFDWDFNEEAWPLLMDFLKNIKPMVRDLQATTDAMFIHLYAGTDQTEPGSTDRYLTERARKHVEQFHGILPPVL